MTSELRYFCYVTHFSKLRKYRDYFKFLTSTALLLLSLPSVRNYPYTPHRIPHWMSHYAQDVELFYSAILIQVPKISLNTESVRDEGGEDSCTEMCAWDRNWLSLIITWNEWIQTVLIPVEF